MIYIILKKKLSCILKIKNNFDLEFDEIWILCLKKLDEINF